MDKLKIIGNKKLSGSIKVSGAKNSALPVMVASLLSNEGLCIKNLPELADITTMKLLLKNFGLKIKQSDSSIFIDSSKIKNCIADYDLVRKMRASILVLGPLLARFKKAKISLPGGCSIGTRPIDIHLFGLEKLGVKFLFKNGFVNGVVKGNLTGCKINLPFPSVGATENLMMAATLAKGKTIISNAAKEPEVEDLAKCLNDMGAKITGAGSNSIKIQGVKNLKKTNHEIIPDRIVAGTFLIAGIMLKSKFTIDCINADHLTMPIKILKKMGANIEIKKNKIKILPSNNLKGIKLKTAPYPGFPTDLQAQMMSLMSIAKGDSEIKEEIFENRFMHVSELNRLGAKIKISNDTAYIKGDNKYIGAQVMASDLRASVSLVLAGLCAKGHTIINRVYHLDRGYEKIEETLGLCGLKITRIK